MKKDIVWKVIPDFPMYSISEYGDIYSSYKSGKLLSPKEDKDGYLEVCLTHNKVRHYVRVHRLVGKVFLDNPENLPLINHKDLNVKNNHYSNLEWCTYLHNTKHFYENSLNHKSLSSFTKEELLAIVESYNSGKSQKEVAELFGLQSRPDVISEIVTGRRFSELTGIVKTEDFKQRTTEKISDEDVLFILKSVHELKIPQKTLCDSYDMSPAQLSRIVNGSRRKEIYNLYMSQLK